MTNKHIFSFIVIILLQSVPAISAAFSLGSIQVKSALNTPFEAEVGVADLVDAEVDSMVVNLASSSEFVKAGLERNAAVNQLRFLTIKRESGIVLRIFSNTPMREPFLSFLVSASTSKNSSLREYTVLLDPPKSAYTTKPAAVSPPMVAAQPSSISSLKSQAEIKGATTPAEPSRPRKATQNNLLGQASARRIAKGDTLWSIASNARPSNSVSVQQMMMALLRANPEAFHRGNINGLERGTTLEIPTSTEIASLNKRAALAAVKAQHRDWRGAKPVHQPIKPKHQQVPSSLSEPTEIPTDAPNATTIETDESLTENMPDEVLKETSGTSSTANVAATLELLAPTAEDLSTEQDLAGLGEAEVQRVNAHLTLAKEALDTKTQETLELKEQMAKMAEQIETLQRLMSLKDGGLATLQSRLSEEDETLELDDMLIDDTSEIEMVDEADGAAMPMDEVLELDDMLVDDMSEIDVVDETDEAIVVTDEALSVTPSDEEKSFVQLLGQWWGSFGTLLLGALLTILALIWFFIKNQNKEGTSTDSAEEWNAFAADTSDEAEESDEIELTEHQDDTMDLSTLFEQASQSEPSEGVLLEETETVAGEIELPIFQDENIEITPIEMEPILTEETQNSELTAEVREEVEEASFSPDESDVALEFTVPSIEEVKQSTSDRAINLDEVPAEAVDMIDFSEAAEPVLKPISSSIDSGDTPVSEAPFIENDYMDEAETKLDLASAYIDMDEPSGASDILAEVIAEGNDEQKLRAQDLLNSIT